MSQNVKTCNCLRLNEIDHNILSNNNIRYKIGIEQGIERGIEQEAMRMAAKLKSLGIEMNIILESTGLTREQIEKL